MEVAEKFHSKYVICNGTNCWEWQGSLHKGYGRIMYKGKDYPAHRFSYLLYYGNLPNNLLVCHKCDNPSCVNPDHLFLGTYKDNAQDMVNKRRQAKGSKQGSAKLNELQIRIIRRLLEYNILIQQEIADIFDVTQGHISSIKHKRKWK